MPLQHIRGAGGMWPRDYTARYHPDSGCELSDESEDDVYQEDDDRDTANRAQASHFQDLEERLSRIETGFDQKMQLIQNTLDQQAAKEAPADRSPILEAMLNSLMKTISESSDGSKSDALQLQAKLATVLEKASEKKYEARFNDMEAKLGDIIGKDTSLSQDQITEIAHTMVKIKAQMKKDNKEAEQKAQEEGLKQRATAKDKSSRHQCGKKSSKRAPSRIDRYFACTATASILFPEKVDAARKLEKAQKLLEAKVHILKLESKREQNQIEDDAERERAERKSKAKNRKAEKEVQAATQQAAKMEEAQKKEQARSAISKSKKKR